jgi:hypothetical protein
LLTWKQAEEFPEKKEVVVEVPSRQSPKEAAKLDGPPRRVLFQQSVG